MQLRIQPPVYPRARGGTPRFCWRSCLPTRFIPARVGEPLSQMLSGGTAGVYPRARGGTSGRCGSAPYATGLSPRAWGNRTCGNPGAGTRRFIPARVGEPRCQLHHLPPHRVYPRARGGTVAYDLELTICDGLSPRAWGNHGKPGVTYERIGFIPARVGEPNSTLPETPRHRVYPRARGGTPDRGRR